MMIVLAIGGADGAITGGWEYIIVAYLATWVFFGGYALTLFVRSK